MNSIDIIIGILLIIGLFIGFWKGLIIELASLLSVVLGIYGAIHFSFYVSDYVSTYVSWSQERIEIVAFIVTLIGIMLLVMLIGKILSRMFSLIALGFINRILGGLFGLLKVAIVIGAILLFIDKGGQNPTWLPKESVQDSKLYEPVKRIGEMVYTNVINELSSVENLPDNLEIVEKLCLIQDDLPNNH